MIEFACHSWAFNDLPLTEALGTIARLGFRCVDIGGGVHINTAHVAQDPRGAAAEIKRDLEAYNLRLSDVYLMLPRIAASDEDKRRKEIDLYKSLLPFIIALETPGVTLSPGVGQAGDEGAYDRAVIALREMLEASQLATPATRLRVSVEPHIDSVAAQPEDALRLVADVPGLSLTLDWAHLVCQGVPMDDIAVLLPDTRHVQIRQAARDRLQTPYADGQIDMAQVMTLLHTARYEGVVCVEYMKMPGWHGMMDVNAIQESARLRDVLRSARDNVGVGQR